MLWSRRDTRRHNSTMVMKMMMMMSVGVRKCMRKTLGKFILYSFSFPQFHTPHHIVIVNGEKLCSMLWCRHRYNPRAAIAIVEQNYLLSLSSISSNATNKYEIKYDVLTVEVVEEQQIETYGRKMISGVKMNENIRNILSRVTGRKLAFKYI